MNRKQTPIVMHLICFVGWNAQSAMGGFLFPRLQILIWIVQMCYVLLDGMLKRQWVFCPQKRNMWKVLVFVGRACQQQWGVSLVEVQVVEKYWFLLDGDVNGNGGFHA